jgi:hypothetical protein
MRLFLVLAGLCAVLSIPQQIHAHSWEQADKVAHMRAAQMKAAQMWKRGAAKMAAYWQRQVATKAANTLLADAQEGYVHHAADQTRMSSMNQGESHQQAIFSAMRQAMTMAGRLHPNVKLTQDSMEVGMKAGAEAARVAYEEGKPPGEVSHEAVTAALTSGGFGHINPKAVLAAKKTMEATLKAAGHTSPLNSMSAAETAGFAALERGKSRAEAAQMAVSAAFAA